VARCGGDVGRGYGDDRAAAASAIVGAGEGEELGRRECVREVGRGVGLRPTSAERRGVRQRGRELRGALLCSPSST
jgi:hypothetical protein